MFTYQTLVTREAGLEKYSSAVGPRFTNKDDALDYAKAMNEIAILETGLQAKLINELKATRNCKDCVWRHAYVSECLSDDIYAYNAPSCFLKRSEKEGCIVEGEDCRVVYCGNYCRFRSYDDQMHYGYEVVELDEDNDGYNRKIDPAAET